MPPILPAIGEDGRCLADVLVSVFAAIRGVENPMNLPPVRRAVIVLVDGLGSSNLTLRAAHARTLSSLSRRDVNSGFPTTTASALTTLMTGKHPGETGMVGYAIRDPRTGTVINQLSGLDAVDPFLWQPFPTLWELNADIPSAIVSAPRYRDSGLTRAILRGAAYRGAKSNDDRLGAVRNFLSENRHGVVYVYVPELDMTAHASGVKSDQWVRKLEELDGFIADLQRLLAAGDGLLVTADHGVIDIPAAKHLIVPAGSDLLSGVVVGGEPRFLHLYCNDVDLTHRRWSEAEGHRAHVVRRDDAIAAGWFGRVSDDMRDRIGDVLVTPRGESVYYLDGVSSPQSMTMVGQHGGLNAAEIRIPILTGGAFA